jgi:hypothetical protein
MFRGVVEAARPPELVIITGGPGSFFILPFSDRLQLNGLKALAALSKLAPNVLV